MSENAEKNNYEKDGEFYITGVFDKTIGTEIIPALRKKVKEESAKKEGKIVFFINSPGGYTSQLKSILFLIEQAKKAKVTVETNILGDAFSCGSLLACSGTKGHRFIYKHGQHLCHFGSAWTYSATPTELERNSEYVKRHFDFIATIYKENTKKEFAQKVEEYMKTDSYFVSAKDSVKFGLADKIV